MKGLSGPEDKHIKARKPYTITKTRERWSDDEHARFIEALKLYGRQWRRIEEHVGTKTAVQIRSHAQKFFNKLEKQKEIGAPVPEVHGLDIPPPRPKKKPTKPYPRNKPPSGTPSAQYQPQQHHSGAGGNNATSARTQSGRPVTSGTCGQYQMDEDMEPQGVSDDDQYYQDYGNTATQQQTGMSEEDEADEPGDEGNMQTYQPGQEHQFVLQHKDPAVSAYASRMPRNASGHMSAVTSSHFIPYADLRLPLMPHAGPGFAALPAAPMQEIVMPNGATLPVAPALFMAPNGYASAAVSVAQPAARTRPSATGPATAQKAYQSGLTGSHPSSGPPPANNGVHGTDDSNAMTTTHRTPTTATAAPEHSSRLQGGPQQQGSAPPPASQAPGHHPASPPPPMSQHPSSLPQHQSLPSQMGPGPTPLAPGQALDYQTQAQHVYAPHPAGTATGAGTVALTDGFSSAPTMNPAALNMLNNGVATVPMLEEEVDGEISEITVAAVAAAASAAAAAAAAAVVAAAGQQVQAHLQANPPKGFPFFGLSPSLLAQLSLYPPAPFEIAKSGGLPGGGGGISPTSALFAAAALQAAQQPSVAPHLQLAAALQLQIAPLSSCMVGAQGQPLGNPARLWPGIAVKVEGGRQGTGAAAGGGRKQEQQSSSDDGVSSLGPDQQLSPHPQQVQHLPQHPHPQQDAPGPPTAQPSGARVALAKLSKQQQQGGSGSKERSGWLRSSTIGPSSGQPTTSPDSQVVNVTSQTPEAVVSSIDPAEENAQYDSRSQRGAARAGDQQEQLQQQEGDGSGNAFAGDGRVVYSSIAEGGTAAQGTAASRQDMVVPPEEASVAVFKPQARRHHLGASRRHQSYVQSTHAVGHVPGSNGNTGVIQSSAWNGSSSVWSTKPGSGKGTSLYNQHGISISGLVDKESAAERHDRIVREQSVAATLQGGTRLGGGTACLDEGGMVGDDEGGAVAEDDDGCVSDACSSSGDDEAARRDRDRVGLFGNAAGNTAAVASGAAGSGRRMPHRSSNPDLKGEHQRRAQMAHRSRSPCTSDNVGALTHDEDGGLRHATHPSHGGATLQHAQQLEEIIMQPEQRADSDFNVPNGSGRDNRAATGAVVGAGEAHGSSLQYPAANQDGSRSQENGQECGSNGNNGSNEQGSNGNNTKAAARRTPENMSSGNGSGVPNVPGTLHLTALQHGAVGDVAPNGNGSGQGSGNGSNNGANDSNDRSGANGTSVRHPHDASAAIDAGQNGSDGNTNATTNGSDGVTINGTNGSDGVNESDGNGKSSNNIMCQGSCGNGTSRRSKQATVITSQHHHHHHNAQRQAHEQGTQEDGNGDGSGVNESNNQQPNSNNNATSQAACQPSGRTASAQAQTQSQNKTSSLVQSASLGRATSGRGTAMRSREREPDSHLQAPKQQQLFNEQEGDPVEQDRYARLHHDGTHHHHQQQQQQAPLPADGVASRGGSRSQPSSQQQQPQHVVEDDCQYVDSAQQQVVFPRTYHHHHSNHFSHHRGAGGGMPLPPAAPGHTGAPGRTSQATSHLSNHNNDNITNPNSNSPSGAQYGSKIENQASLTSNGGTSSQQQRAASTAAVPAAAAAAGRSAGQPLSTGRPSLHMQHLSKKERQASNVNLAGAAQHQMHLYGHMLHGHPQQFNEYSRMNRDRSEPSGNVVLSALDGAQYNDEHAPHHAQHPAGQSQHRPITTSSRRTASVHTGGTPTLSGQVLHKRSTEERDDDLHAEGNLTAPGSARDVRQAREIVVRDAVHDVDGDVIMAPLPLPRGIHHHPALVADSFHGAALAHQQATPLPIPALPGTITVPTADGQYVQLLIPNVAAGLHAPGGGMYAITPGGGVLPQTLVSFPNTAGAAAMSYLSTSQHASAAVLSQHPAFGMQPLASVSPALLRHLTLPEALASAAGNHLLSVGNQVQVPQLLPGIQLMHPAALLQHQQQQQHSQHTQQQPQHSVDTGNTGTKHVHSVGASGQQQQQSASLQHYVARYAPQHGADTQHPPDEQELMGPAGSVQDLIHAHQSVYATALPSPHLAQPHFVSGAHHPGNASQQDLAALPGVPHHVVIQAEGVGPGSLRPNVPSVLSLSGLISPWQLPTHVAPPDAVMLQHSATNTDAGAMHAAHAYVEGGQAVHAVSAGHGRAAHSLDTGNGNATRKRAGNAGQGGPAAYRATSQQHGGPRPQVSAPTSVQAQSQAQRSGGVAGVKRTRTGSQIGAHNDVVGVNTSESIGGKIGAQVMQGVLQHLGGAAFGPWASHDPAYQHAHDRMQRQDKYPLFVHAAPPPSPPPPGQPPLAAYQLANMQGLAPVGAGFGLRDGAEAVMYGAEHAAGDERQGQSMSPEQEAAEGLQQLHKRMCGPVPVPSS